MADKVAIVTGASRGIGFAIAQRLAAQGYRVAITGRDPVALEAAAKELDGAVFVAGKGDDAAHRATVIDTVVEKLGPVTTLVNNIGINPAYGPLATLDLNAARKMAEVNLIGTLGWVQEALRGGLGSAGGGGGSIVNISSVSGVRPAPGIAFYGTTKAALIHLTEELAVELAPGIRVNAVAPAVVKTRFASALFEGREEQVSATYPLKRLGAPEDVAGAVAFLCSPEASWITGQTLVIDGGVTLTGVVQ